MIGKKILDESKARLIEDTVIVPEETIEEIPETETEISDEQVKNAFSAMINDLVSDEFNSIRTISSIIATLEAENIESKKDIQTILQNILDEKNINVGMLTKTLELLDPKKVELMNNGIEKAEEVISEPASTDLNQ